MFYVIQAQLCRLPLIAFSKVHNHEDTHINIFVSLTGINKKVRLRVALISYSARQVPPLDQDVTRQWRR
jgi:hypothetical protein